MARIRTVKPEFWQDEDLAALSAEANLLAIGLLNQADDEGFFKANPMLLNAAVFPIRETSSTIHCLISELSNIGYIKLFDGSDGKQYGHVTNFLKHQKINRPTPSKYAPLIEFTEETVSPHTKRAGKGKERKGKERSNSDTKFTPPSVDEVVEYLVEKVVPNPKPLANRFIGFYESKGWMVGKNKMKLWKSALSGGDWIDDHRAKEKTRTASRHISELNL